MAWHLLVSTAPQQLRAKRSAAPFLRAGKTLFQSRCTRARCSTVHGDTLLKTNLTPVQQNYSYTSTLPFWAFGNPRSRRAAAWSSGGGGAQERVLVAAAGGESPPSHLCLRGVGRRPLGWWRVRGVAARRPLRHPEMHKILHQGAQRVGLDRRAAPARSATRPDFRCTLGPNSFCGVGGGGGAKERGVQKET